MTIGMIASTRSSVAPVIQVVQPRFEPPATTNPCTGIPSSFDHSSMQSIALTTLFTIGSRGSQVASPLSRN